MCVLIVIVVGFGVTVQHTDSATARRPVLAAAAAREGLTCSVRTNFSGKCTQDSHSMSSELAPEAALVLGALHNQTQQ
jgi:hypothetical protein